MVLYLPKNALLGFRVSGFGVAGQGVCDAKPVVNTADVITSQVWEQGVAEAMKVAEQRSASAQVA